MIRLENVLKMSWRHLSKTSWRWFEDVFKTSWRYLQNVFKTSSKRLEDVYKYIRLEDVLKKSSGDVWLRWMHTSWLWRRLLKTKTYDVFKTYSSDVFMWCTIYKLKVLLLKKKHFHTKLPCQKPMLKQIKWKVQNERNKERSFATNYSLKVLTVFCETVFGFLEQSANRDSKWFSDIRKPNGFTHTGNWTWFP